MKSRNKKRLLALVLCMVVAISNSSFIFASETGQAEYPQEAEVQTQDEAVANDMDVVAYAADEGQAVADEQPAAVEQVAAEPAAEPETTAENQAAQPVAEAPAAEQPTTEAPAAEASAAQAPAAAPTEEIAPASENATAETPEEDATQVEAENQQLTWSQAVGNTTVNVTAEAGALPADAQLSVTEITAEDEVKEIEKAVEEKAIEEQFSIKNIFSYDIKFLVNGSEVQPTTPVQVSVDTPEITSSEDAAVLHVADNNVAEDMKGAVDGEGKVVFDAPHFSKYVIVQKGTATVTVTVEHYDNSQTPAEKIYSSKYTLSVGGSVKDFVKTQNWELEKIKVGNETDGYEEISEEAASNIEAVKDTTIRVYCKPETSQKKDGVTFYDYTVKAGTMKNGTVHSINDISNYSQNTNGKLTVGENKRNYDYDTVYHAECSASNGRNANGYIGQNNQNPITGLISSLDGNDQPVFNYADPGFFNDEDIAIAGNWKKINKEWADGKYTYSEGDSYSSETRYTRKVYKNYKLEFTRSGERYELSAVYDKDDTKVTNAGSGFYPLDGVRNDYELENSNTEYDSNGYPHNNYFGMRYDVNFKIGDYVGPLNYEFTGDDDMWVLLDGKKVIIDLGGIHDALTKNVNIWKELFNVDDPTSLTLTNDQKQEEHVLTVLYMERGAGASNCDMKFTLPNARVAQVTQEPLADFSFKKVNTTNEPLEGAAFSLTNNSDSTEVYNATSVADGTVSFRDLREGTYILEEIAAPNGYSLSNETWIVKVSNTGDSAVATLYNSDGKTDVKPTNGVYNIVNQTQQEIIKSSMEHSKTATVKDWNDRTYNINITAASTSTSETTSTQKPVADIMLVLDVSGSMDYNIVTYNYVAMNTDEGRGGLKKNKTYYLETNGKYKELTYYYGSGWYVDGGSKAERYSKDCKIYTKSTTTRLDALKNSVNQFIDDTEAKSPKSKIGITAFSSAGYGANHGDHGSTMDLTEVGVGDNAQDLKKFVNELDANGGTDPGVGLSNAKTKLDAVANDGKTKCVVLFTDGEPTGGGSSWDTDAQKSAETKAKELRDTGYTVYTIGFALNDKSKAFLAGGTYNDKKYPGIASPGCAKVADDAASLGEIFREIQSTITNDIDIVDATVTDVIDSRFVIVKDDGTAIKNEELKDKKTITLENGGVVSLDDKGNQVVTWTDQTIPNKKNGTWDRTITVKAKDDYIGGNNVPTNVTPDSKITTGYGEVVLPQPKVNVKAKLEVRDKEVTIYKGDSLPNTNTVLNEMFDLAGNTDKYNIPKKSFTIKWYSNPDCTPETEVKDLTANTDATYYLKVSYNAGEPSDDSTKNTNGNIAGGTNHIVDAVNEKDSAKLYGIYTIKVVSGEIQITKKLESALKTECTFHFSIKNESGDEIKNVSITIPTGSTEVKFDGKDLKDLPRGTYTISEVDSNGYVLTDYQIDDSSTNCGNTRNEEQESVTFKLGYEETADSNGKDVNVIKDYTYDPKSGGTVGSVTFTNEKATTAWDIVKVSTSGNQVHLSGAEFVLQQKEKTVYTGTSNDDGKIIWKKDGTVVSSLEKGEYTLKETKAPTGYVLSNEVWTIKTTKGGSLVSYTTDKSNGKIDKSEISETDRTLHLYFKNEVVYNLPSTGHTGIFNILISGILLMFAGILIIYKMKGKEVLKNKKP